MYFLQLGDDVKQHFLGGCDQFIDKTVKGSVKTVEECRIKVKSLEGEFRQSSASVSLGIGLNVHCYLCE